jgi:hypothetical protein
MSATERADEFGVVDEAPTRRTALDFIRATHEELKSSEVRTVTLRDPARPEFELVCEVPTDMDDTLDINERAEKTAKSPNAPAEPVVMACMLLARFTRRLRVRGKDVNDDPVGAVFADPALQDALGAPNAWRAVRELFMVKGGKYDDGVVNRLALTLLTEGGLSRTDGVEVQDGAEDPT